MRQHKGLPRSVPTLAAWCALAFAAAHAQQQPSPPGASAASSPSADLSRGYSTQPYVFEKYATSIRFSADGSNVGERSMTVRVQTDAGVRQFGLLTVPYAAEFERVEITYARVRKPDGTVVPTPDSNVQDLPMDVTRAAPMYSDLRMKHVPVKALGAGDVLEFAVRVVRSHSEAPGQFWFEQSFIDNAVVLEEILQIEVPSGTAIRVKSPSLEPQVEEKAETKIFRWKRAQLQPPQTPKQKKATVPPPSVQLTTFASWAEVAKWYQDLQESRGEPTPRIRAKATELTQGLESESEKSQAIFRYVATKFRYIALSFGVGRYRAHPAEEVLDNQYGDCKDKHTLLTALLKAAGIKAWPALVAMGRKADTELPSPAPFRHVVTVLPQDGKYLWLDATAEVAPFGVLPPAVRDQGALLIPSTGPASWVTTPAELPFESTTDFQVKSSLSAEGTLTGHIDFTLRGDKEYALRTLLRAAPPSQWQEVIQRFSYSSGFMGTVNSVVAENVETADSALHVSYDYERKDYADWKNYRIVPPLPLFNLVPASGPDAPEKDVPTSGPSTERYSATLQLPPGFSVELPPNSKAQCSFAEYQATYSISDGLLTAERRFAWKKPKILAGSWPEYIRFVQAVGEDLGRFIVLSKTAGGAAASVVQSDTRAAALVQQALRDMQAHSFASAEQALINAQEINPKERGLWPLLGVVREANRQYPQAVEAYQHELREHPDNLVIYRALADLQRRLGKLDEAIDTVRRLIAQAPADVDAALQFCSLLVAAQRYGEAVDTARSAMKLAPGSLRPQLMLIESLLRAGTTEQGMSEAQSLADRDHKPATLNDLAYVLAEAGTELAKAREYAESALTALYADSARVTLANLRTEDFVRMNQLARVWDTVGWIYFKAGDSAKAERFLNAAWMLDQDGVIGDHLAHVFERQGKKELAARTYVLVVQAPNAPERARDRLRAFIAELGISPAKGGSVQGRSPNAPAWLGEQLARLRTTPVPGLSSAKTSAEFFVLFSAGKVEDVQLISGADELKGAGAVLRNAQFNVPFPDNGPEKLVRRGILSCSAYSTPNCTFVFLRLSESKR